MNQNERIVKNFTDVLVKYMDSRTNVKVFMKNGFQTRGIITEVYSDGLQFQDFDGKINEIPISAVSTVMVR